MKGPLILRRRHERELAFADADRERLRSERNQFAKDRNAFKAAAETAARQFAEADTANRRLADRNLELGRRISTLTEADPEYTAGLERRVNRLRAAGHRVLAAYGTEKERADLLQATANADALKAIQEWEQRVKAYTAWTAPADLEKRPVDGGSWRPTHPAVVLRRALDRCRALEERLAAAEGRKKAVSGS